MKAKIAGIAILVVVIIGVVLFKFLYLDNQKPQITLKGYIGSEKAGLLDDQNVKDILRKKYGISFNYSSAGSLDMITADQSGRDFLFPSNEVAYELYKSSYNTTPKNKVTFSSPLVFYTHGMVLDALVKKGVVSEQGGVYYCDMKKMTDLLLADTKWSDIGCPELYGNVSIFSTDPEKSNSGNMFACLLATILNDGKVVDTASIDAVMPKLKGIFSKLGYMEASSGILFNNFLTTGVGSKPIMVGYENQLLEFASSPQNASAWNNLKDDIKIIYPVPTIWSNHTYIAIGKNGELGIDALMDNDIQSIAWRSHGFRTGPSNDISVFSSVKGLSLNITQVVPLPSYKTIDKILVSLKNQ